MNHERVQAALEIVKLFANQALVGAEQTVYDGALEALAWEFPKSKEVTREPPVLADVDGGVMRHTSGKYPDIDLERSAEARFALG